MELYGEEGSVVEVPWREASTKGENGSSEASGGGIKNTESGSGSHGVVVFHWCCGVSTHDGGVLAVEVAHGRDWCAVV